MKKIILFCFFIMNSIASFCQENILDSYIAEGLQNNLTLQQKEFSCRKSLQALREAKGMFLPDISINARYSVADGGRVIDISTGDLMNPVYSSLNAITSYLNQLNEAVSVFPEMSIENQEINFLRTTEHETKVRLVQPVYNPKISQNYKIKQKMVSIEQEGIEIYKRQLISDIKTAYFNYLKTVEVLEILDNTRLLLEENIRLNKKLYENQKITVDNVYRSRVEADKLEQEYAQAYKMNKMAASYFNFLLNKDLTSKIIISKDVTADVQQIEINTAQANAIQNREELEMMKKYSGLNENLVKLNKSENLPTVSAVVDYGFQGSEYSFTSEDDFLLASVVLRWSIFKGRQNDAKIKQAEIDKQITDLKYKELQRQVALQVVNAYYDLEAARKAVDAAKSRKTSTEKSFRIIDRQYTEGQANLLQYIDARTSMTNARQNLVIAKYDYQVKHAEFEKVTASYPLDTL